MDFDDGRLDDPAALQLADEHLRELAFTGARLRLESEAADEPLSQLVPPGRPRAVLAIGNQARFLRAVLAPVCPVPFVAWQEPTLPGWVGPLDIVVVLGVDDSWLAGIMEATRRGCQVIWSCTPHTEGAESWERRATILPSSTGDPLAAGIVMLSALHALGLGPHVPLDSISDSLDAVAEECSVHRTLITNPAKGLASQLADGQPLVFGTSVLAARAARGIAEGLRQASGRVALAADARELLSVVAGTPARDVFADPFEEPTQSHPTLLFLDDGLSEYTPHVRILLEVAESREIPVNRIQRSANGSIERYATMLLEGLFSSVYLQVGLGRPFAALRR